MKLGFIAHNDLEDIETDCRFAVEHGFSGLEFNYWGGFKDLTPETVAQMRASLDRHGIECSTFGLWGWNHIASDAAERAESHKQLTRAIHFAQTMRAPIWGISRGARSWHSSTKPTTRVISRLSHTGPYGAASPCAARCCS